MYSLPKDSDRFDPRKHASVLLNINEKQQTTTPGLAGGSTSRKTQEFSLRTLVVGPHVKTGAETTARPFTAPAGSINPDPMSPRYLDRNGKWIASELSSPVQQTQRQALTATNGNIAAYVAHSTKHDARGTVRPVSAVHSYADISPVVTAEHVREPSSGQDGATLAPGATLPGAGGTDLLHTRPELDYLEANPTSYKGGDGENYYFNDRDSGPKPRMSQQQKSYLQQHASGMHGGSGANRVGLGPDYLTASGSIYASSAGRRRSKTPGPRPRPAAPAPLGPIFYAKGRTASHSKGHFAVATSRSIPDAPLPSAVTTLPGKEPSPYLASLYSANTRGPTQMPTHRPGTTGRPRQMPAHTKVLGASMGTAGSSGDRSTQATTVLRAGELGEPLTHPVFDYEANDASRYAHNPHYPVGLGSAYDKEFAAAAGESDNLKTTAPAAGPGEGQVNPHAPYAAASTNPYWPKQQVEATHLTRPDLLREEKLGKGVVPGSANTRLVGGQWKYLPRPTEGDVLYTDYYGRYGPEHANYYGRSYRMDLNDFSKNRLVNDAAYQRVQASMTGIQNLRERPGLAMESTIVHGPNDSLQQLTDREAVASLQSLHRISQYHNLHASKAISA
ncbi:hypothetical protein V8C86DRAFT_2511221 [Haematococcus lacustris]